MYLTYMYMYGKVTVLTYAMEKIKSFFSWGSSSQKEEI